MTTEIWGDFTRLNSICEDSERLNHAVSVVGKLIAKEMKLKEICEWMEGKLR